MLQSMTGFGQSALTSELGEITIEIKSLNSKNFDINFGYLLLFAHDKGNFKNIKYGKVYARDPNTLQSIVIKRIKENLEKCILSTFRP